VAQASSLWGLVLARTNSHRLEACATGFDIERSACVYKLEQDTALEFEKNAG